MGRPRLDVTGPAVTSLPFGLWSVVQPATEPGRRWRNGVQYQPDPCEAAGSTQGSCPPPDDPSPDPTKPATSTIPTVGADPVTVYAWVDCGPVGGHWEAARARAVAALTAGEARAVEHVFWTGETTTGPTDLVHPHLAADTEIAEPTVGQDVLVQPAAVTPQAGAMDPVEAIGVLEAAMAGCYGGTPVIHVPRSAVAHLASYRLIERQGQQLRTPGGSLVAAGAGYPGIGPDGLAPAYPATWFYATGAVAGWRSDVEVPSSREESLDRGMNRLLLLAERTYVISWDCCLFAAQVHLGGRAGGSPNSADPLP